MKAKVLYCVVISATGVIVATEKAYTEKQALFLLGQRGFYVSEQLMDLQPAHLVSPSELLAFRRKQHVTPGHVRYPTNGGSHDQDEEPCQLNLHLDLLR